MARRITEKVTLRNVYLERKLYAQNGKYPVFISAPAKSSWIIY